MNAHLSKVALALLVACSGSGKDDTTDTYTGTTETGTSTSDTWWTDTGGVCTGGGLCLCPDETCGAEAGVGDCDRDDDGCICAVANDNFGDCPTTSGGSGHSGGSGSTTTTTTDTDPTTPGSTGSTGDTGLMGQDVTTSQDQGSSVGVIGWVTTAVASLFGY